MSLKQRVEKLEKVIAAQERPHYCIVTVSPAGKGTYQITGGQQTPWLKRTTKESGDAMQAEAIQAAKGTTNYAARKESGPATWQLKRIASWYPQSEKVQQAVNAALEILEGGNSNG